MSDLPEIKEVLRELLEKMWSWYAIEKPTPYDRQCYSKSLKNTLAKLDGKGGEKSVPKHGTFEEAVHGNMRENVKTPSQDSKPPEQDLRKGKVYVVVEREALLKMVLELRNNIYGFDKEEWFTDLEKQIDYDHKKTLKEILKERKQLSRRG